MKKSKLLLFVLSGVIIILSSCSSPKSPTTGWAYNDPHNGGFEVQGFDQQRTGPGLVFVEGGSFIMGRTNEDVLFDWNNMPRKVSISSFYMDETEVRNLDYLEYLFWVNRVFGTDYPQVYRKALPDTLVWRDRLAYNEPLVEYYFRHPAYREYPVVGVSWSQATDYASWRTDRVNEKILIEQGVLRDDPDQRNENNFNTEAYLAGQYEGIVRKDLRDLNPTGKGTRKVRMEDGILLPKYRLPTEAEWEYAALGLIGNTFYERITDRKMYPWNGSIVRTDNLKHYGDFVANFKRGRGDYMGIAGYLNDAEDIPAPVKMYYPNDFGLYNMAGNVAEWVQDVYRPLSFEDVSDLRPFRGNVFKVLATDEEGKVAQKDSLGRLKWREVTDQEAAVRDNYKKADNVDYGDGDLESSIYFLEEDYKDKADKRMYEYGASSLISNRVHVYKGGSWKDGPYYMNPGVRRFLDQDKATEYIGFRCAMIKVGSPFPSTFDKGKKAR